MSFVIGGVWGWRIGFFFLVLMWGISKMGIEYKNKKVFLGFFVIEIIMIVSLVFLYCLRLMFLYIGYVNYFCFCSDFESGYGGY